MKSLGSTKTKITEDKIGEYVTHLKINKGVIIHCNILNNNYQQNSRPLYTFAPNKLYVKLLDILPNFFIFKDLQFLHVKLCLTDQNSRQLVVEGKKSINLL